MSTEIKVTHSKLSLVDSDCMSEFYKARSRFVLHGTRLEISAEPQPYDHHGHHLLALSPEHEILALGTAYVQNSEGRLGIFGMKCAHQHAQEGAMVLDGLEHWLKDQGCSKVSKEVLGYELSLLRARGYELLRDTRREKGPIFSYQYFLVEKDLSQPPQ